MGSLAAKADKARIGALPPLSSRKAERLRRRTSASPLRWPAKTKFHPLEAGSLALSGLAPSRNLSAATGGAGVACSPACAWSCGAAPDNTYYRVIIRTERTSTLREKGKPLPVLPGMTATVDMRTGERSVLNFLLRPMLKSKEAFRER